MNEQNVEQIEDDVIYILSCPECDIAFPTLGKDMTISADEDEEVNEKRYLTAKHIRCGNYARVRTK